MYFRLTNFLASIKMVSCIGKTKHFGGMVIHMSEPEYFKNALSNFTFETACGGAIRHLTDLGYTVKQITEQLDFPTSYERVQKAVWERLLDTGVICLTPPGSGKTSEKAEFVKDYDKYGKVSFRKVSHPVIKKESVCFRESYLGPKDSFASFLREHCSRNGPSASYISCDFVLKKDCPSATLSGFHHAQVPSHNGKADNYFQELLQVLDEKQQEYLTGLPWANQLCYHRLDLRMQEIIIRLYENGKYQGTCFFLETKEKIHIS